MTGLSPSCETKLRRHYYLCDYYTCNTPIITVTHRVTIHDPAFTNNNHCLALYYAMLCYLTIYPIPQPIVVLTTPLQCALILSGDCIALILIVVIIVVVFVLW